MKHGLGDLKNQAALFNKIKNQGLSAVRQLKQYLNQPEYNKQPKRFKLSEIVEILDIPRTSIRHKEQKGVFDYTKNQDISNKTSYSVKELNEIRHYFNKGFYNGSIHRPLDLEPVVIAFSMFKGGVGKTTHATHLAAHCAIHGMKTLLVDLDPQASSTFMFGYLPSVDLNNGETIRGALLENFDSINKIIKSTHYDDLDIITSGLELQGADIVLPNESYNNSDVLGTPLLRLKKCLNIIKDRYDVIILDCAPNHASITMNALAAANGIIIPISPNMLSYGSSIHFMETLEELASTLYAYNNMLKEHPNHPDIPYIETSENKLFRILITNDPGDSESQDITSAIRALYGDFVLPRPMSRTIALSRTANDLSLLYDQKKSAIRGSKESYNRGLVSMKNVNDDILTIISSICGVNYEK